MHKHTYPTSHAHIHTYTQIHSHCCTHITDLHVFELSQPNFPSAFPPLPSYPLSSSSYPPLLPPSSILPLLPPPPPRSSLFKHDREEDQPRHGKLPHGVMPLLYYSCFFVHGKSSLSPTPTPLPSFPSPPLQTPPPPSPLLLTPPLPLLLSSFPLHDRIVRVDAMQPVLPP